MSIQAVKLFLNLLISSCSFDKHVPDVHGHSFHYHCSQDRQRAYADQRVLRPTESDNDGQPRFNCVGGISIRFDLNRGEVAVALSHYCAHPAYEKCGTSSKTPIPSIMDSDKHSDRLAEVYTSEVESSATSNKRCEP